MSDTEFVRLYEGQEFKNCSCSKSTKNSYSINHHPKPIDLPKKMVEAIEMLLWYSPNISSEQSFSNDYLKDPKFDNAIITYCARYLEIEPEDFCFISGDSISEELLDPYIGTVCTKCQKIIVCKKTNETKISCILRHLRNCIAHGRFNLINGKHFIGFDYDPRNKDQCTALIKLDIKKVHDFCKQIINYPDFTISHIFQYILLKSGFSIIGVITPGKNFTDPDTTEEIIFAIRNDQALRINCSRYKALNDFETTEQIEEYTIDLNKKFSKNVSYINVFYSERARKLLRKVRSNTYVISKNGLKALFDGNTELLNEIK